MGLLEITTLLPEPRREGEKCLGPSTNNGGKKKRAYLARKEEKTKLVIGKNTARLPDRKAREGVIYQEKSEKEAETVCHKTNFPSKKERVWGAQGGYCHRAGRNLSDTMGQVEGFVGSSRRVLMGQKGRCCCICRRVTVYWRTLHTGEHRVANIPSGEGFQSTARSAQKNRVGQPE